jgi:hypothetical protein
MTERMIDSIVSIAPSGVRRTNSSRSSQSSGSIASVLSSATNHDDDGLLRPGERVSERYAKRTMKRALAATRKRHAYQLASVMTEANGEGAEFSRWSRGRLSE